MQNFILILFLIPSLLNAQALIQWGPEITVADGSIYGNSRPRATIVGIDSPVVLFGKSGSNENLFVARWNGSSFDTPISFLPSGTSSYLTSWTGPDIASQGDTVIAVFKLEPLEGGHVYSVRSTDGAINFSDTIRVDNHSNGVAWMPSMEMSQNGQIMVTYMAHDGVWSNPRYVLVRSTDTGLTYSTEMEVASAIPGEACDCCPAELVIDNQKQALLFRNNESNIRDIYGVLSTDSGNSFPTYANVDNLDWTINSCPSTGPDGIFYHDTLLSVYASAASGKYRVYVSSSSTDNSLQFEDRMMVSEPVPANGSQNYPRITIDGDTIVMAWRETEGGNQEIYCSISLPGMNPMQALTSYKEKANSTSTGVQTNPEIIYKNGLVHLFYEDGASGNLIYRRGTINVNLKVEENDELVTIFPNPTVNGMFHCENSVSVVNITNAIGDNIPYTIRNAPGQLTIEISNSTKGIYYMYYQHDDNRVNVTKLIVN